VKGPKTVNECRERPLSTPGSTRGITDGPKVSRGGGGGMGGREHENDKRGRGGRRELKKMPLARYPQDHPLRK